MILFNETVTLDPALNLSRVRTRKLLVGWLALTLFVTGCRSGVHFDSTVTNPAFENGQGPTVLFDAAHHNRHAIGSTYGPFAALLKNDGFQIDQLRVPFSPQVLARARILVIVGAISQTETNEESSFTGAEVRAVLNWVLGGGSLLLVTDHYPFPNSADALAKAFGLETNKGMVLDDKHYREGSGDDSRLIFSRSNGLLAPGPIVDGRNSSEKVSVVETFTGDAFKPAQRSAAILNLAPSALRFRGVPEVKRNGGDVSVTVKFEDPKPGDGWAQAVNFQFGRGRVVAVAEAAMLTAQEDGGRKIGMNAPKNDNRQFVLNTMHWLASIL